MTLARKTIYTTISRFSGDAHVAHDRGDGANGGILLGETSQFENVVILAKIPKVEFHSWATPGDTLTYTARLIDKRDDGGMTECTAHVGDRLVAEAEILFAHVSSDAAGGQKIDQKNFVFTMRLLGCDGCRQGRDGASGGVNASHECAIIRKTVPGTVNDAS